MNNEQSAGKPSTTGNPSGPDRDNNPPKPKEGDKGNNPTPPKK